MNMNKSRILNSTYLLEDLRAPTLSPELVGTLTETNFNISDIFAGEAGDRASRHKKQEHPGEGERRVLHRRPRARRHQPPPAARQRPPAPGHQALHEPRDAGPEVPTPLLTLALTLTHLYHIQVLLLPEVHLS